jgi:hypothetical protein
MLTAIIFIIQIITGKSADWLVAVATFTIDECYAFPLGLIPSKGKLNMGR